MHQTCQLRCKTHAWIGVMGRRQPGRCGLSARSAKLQRCCAHKIVLLPGDGIGPEIASVAQKLLQVAGEEFQEEFQFQEHLIGGAAM